MDVSAQASFVGSPTTLVRHEWPNNGMQRRAGSNLLMKLCQGAPLMPGIRRGKQVILYKLSQIEEPK